jgi:hypothetical protein
MATRSCSPGLPPGRQLGRRAAVDATRESAESSGQSTANGCAPWCPPLPATCTCTGDKLVGPMLRARTDMSGVDETRLARKPVRPQKSASWTWFHAPGRSGCVAESAIAILTMTPLRSGRILRSVSATAIKATVENVRLALFHSFSYHYWCRYLPVLSARQAGRLA